MNFLPYYTYEWKLISCHKNNLVIIHESGSDVVESVEVGIFEIGPDSRNESPLSVLSPEVVLRHPPVQNVIHPKAIWLHYYPKSVIICNLQCVFDPTQQLQHRFADGVRNPKSSNLNAAFFFA